MTRPPCRFAALLTTGSMLVGLSGCSPTPSAISTLAVTAVDPPADQVVARVNGAAIGEAQVRLQNAANQSVRGALDALIDEELLHQQALQRGLQQGFAVRRVLSQALANTLLAQEYVSGFTPEQVPAEMVVRAYDLNKGRYVHPELVRLVHIVALAPEQGPADLRTKARRAARLVARRAKRAKPTVKGFMKLSRELADQVAPVELRAEKLVTPGRGHVVAPFADAAFALTRRGQISDVVETRYGYHAIYFVARKAARNVSLEQADAELREHIYDDARRQLMTDQLATLRQTHAVHVDEVALKLVTSQAEHGVRP